MRASSTFQRYERESAEIKIKQYYTILRDRLIEKREEEIRTPWKPTDENYGGSGVGGRKDSAQEITVIKLETDPKLKQYKELIEEVETAMAVLTPYEVDMVELCYLKHNKDTGRTSDKIVAELKGCDPKDVKSTRQKLIDNLMLKR